MSEEVLPLSIRQKSHHALRERTLLQRNPPTFTQPQARYQKVTVHGFDEGKPLPQFSTPELFLFIVL